ncbi:hypothetical protein [Streptomyces europaeiscabiei]|uniref:hypothetical protein n=1 Tax=Streptomyces europaeiscabiei TaxID=146819 RepID=UPI0029AEABC4|nr:hypothetical protein [Streptomyces europaeiscabiei]MDX2760418.1 hypothetical protein [Streptomyces europaeiscabiei]
MIHESANIRAGRKLRQLASDYRSRGYLIVPIEDVSEVPSDIVDLQPDMIVRKPGETIVVELKSSKTVHDPRLEELAEAVSRHKNWKLELIWLGSTPTESLSRQQIQETVSSAREVAQINLTAALLLGWSAAEATLDLLIEKSGSELAEGVGGARSPRAKVSLAESLGLISESLYKTLSQAGDFRNRAAHGLLLEEPSDLSQIVSELLDSVSLLSREGYASPDQMIDWFRANYEDPAESVPFVSSEGGYQYFGGGPYDAQDVLQNQFPDADPRDIDQAAADLQNESYEWVKKDEY